MNAPAAIKLHVADWGLDPVAGEIMRHDDVLRLESRTLRLLQCLATHADEIVCAMNYSNRSGPALSSRLILLILRILLILFIRPLPRCGVYER